MKIERTGKLHYAIWFVILLLIEIYIALEVNDKVIRPYGGDFLVVMLIYCFLMVITRFRIPAAIFIVFVFSLIVEFLQLSNLIHHIPEHFGPAPRIILGHSFSWLDILAYILGLTTVYLAEYFRTRYFNSDPKA